MKERWGLTDEKVRKRERERERGGNE